MKYWLSLSALLLVLGLNACVKIDPNPDQSDYYKNKIIRLNVENINMNTGDNVALKIAALRVDGKPTAKPKLSVNGEVVEGDYFTLLSDLVLAGPVTIQTVDSAWELVVEYTLKKDATPFTLILTPSFNDVAQEPISFFVDKTMNGKLEIKEYN